MCIRDRGKASPMLLEDKGSSRVFVGGTWSLKCPLICCGLSGKSRWNYNKVILSSVWSENMKWCGIESDYEKRARVIELFRLSRDYKGLVLGINIEGNDYIKNNRLTLFNKE